MKKYKQAFLMLLATTLLFALPTTALANPGDDGDLGITVTADKSYPGPGDTVTFTIIASNHGKTLVSSAHAELSIEGELENLQISVDGSTWNTYSTLTFTSFTSQADAVLYARATVQANASEGTAKLKAEIFNDDSGGDPCSDNNTHTAVMTVTRPFAITTTSLPTLTKGVAVTTQLQTNESDPSNVIFTIAGGMLPDGLSLASSGEISGTPTTVGPYQVTIAGTNLRGKTDSKTYNGTVGELPYQVTSAGNTFTGSENIVFTIDADAESFIGLTNGTTTLTKDVDYTVAAGSTIVTLSNTYLNSLANGTYTLSFGFDAQTVTATLVIDKEQPVSNPVEKQSPPASSGTGLAKASDNNGLWIALSLTALSAGTICVALHRKRKLRK